MINYLKVFLLVFFFFAWGDMSAQPGGHGNPCPKKPCPPSVPITGIEYLIALGGLYGVKRLVNRVREK